MSLKKVNNERLCVLLCNYSGRFVVLPHAQLPSLQPTRVNRSFTKYEAVYNVSMLGLNCAINCNSRNGERSCFLAVSMTECITAYASAPRNVRKSPATFCFVFAGLTARSLALSKSCDNPFYPNFSFIPTFSNKNANSLIDR